MSESGVLTFSQLIEVDHVQRQKIFVLKRKSHVVKTGVVRADRDIDARSFTSIKHGFERSEIFQRRRFQIGGRTDLQALTSARYLVQKFRAVERNLNSVPDSIKVGKKFRIKTVFSLEQMASCFQSERPCVLKQVDQLIESSGIEGVRSAEIDAANLVSFARGEVDDRSIDMGRQSAVHAQYLLQHHGVGFHFPRECDSVNDVSHLLDALRFRQFRIRAIVGRMAKLQVDDALKNVSASNELRYEIGKGFNLLNMLDESVQFKKFSQTCARARQKSLELFVLRIFRRQRVATPVQETPENSRNDRASKMSMKFCV